MSLPCCETLKPLIALFAKWDFYFHPSLLQAAFGLKTKIPRHCVPEGFC